jgi:ABC-type branched-subunit amino acid transport system substrate-binding protein
MIFRPSIRRTRPAAAATLATLALALGCGGAVADSADILIGASLPLSGPNAAAGNEGLMTAKAAFDAVNAQGGIGGRKIKLVALDDEFNPAKAAENAKKLNDQGALALFNCWGTASCSAMMPVINEAKLPLVTGIAGGGPMRATPGRYAFNLRPTTENEIARMVGQMQTIGQERVAVVYQDDPFGKSGLAAAQTVMGKAKVTVVSEQPLARDGSNAAAVVAALKAANTNGIVLVASPQATVAVITLARKSGMATQFYNLAAQANRKVVTDLGEHTGGVVFTTLVPNPWRSAQPVVRDYQQAIQTASGKTDYSYLGMEVYLNARILIEGLRHAGTKVTRESLVTALESMGEKAFSNQVVVRYGTNDRSGSTYVGLAIANRDGRFIE